MWTPIINELKKHQSFIISAHTNPDCDALGSELGLAHHLINMGKNVYILNSDPMPSTYAFIDPGGLVETYSPKGHKKLLNQTDAIIVVDASGGWNRLGRVGSALGKLKKPSICIDHHPNSEQYTTVAHVDPTAAATGELIISLIQAMDSVISETMATALYTAIVTDTGNFRFSSTNPHTHRATAVLIEAGAKPARIYNQLYEQHSLEKVQLEGYALQNIATAHNGRTAYNTITLDVLEKYGIASSDLDNFSGMSQKIKGVDVSVFLVELPRKRVKISLRSNGSVPVNQVAALFGGGGHVPAAGATTNGTLEDVLHQVLEEIENLF